MDRQTVRDIGVNICRFAVAATFVFSGFVKAIDPIGTQYKLHDYLAAVGMQELVPDYATLAAAVMLAAVEFSLGIFLLFAIRRRITARLTLAVMTVMTAITVWIAMVDPVKDCGCFGDAVKLTNWQTLAKNVVLLAATAVICRHPFSMVRFISRTNQWIAVNYTIIYSIAMSTWCLYDLPLLDFRPYSVGTDIRKAMEIPEGAEQPEFETTFLMKKNGKTKEFTLENYPDSTWTFVDSKTVQVKEGYVPPIHDFTMEDPTTGNDLTDDILSRRSYTFLLISPHLENADDSNFGDLNRIYDYCLAHKYRFYALTASNRKAVERWRDMTGAEYPFLFTDETTLKTIIRSNPGLLLIKDGTVVRKWSHNRLPQMDENMPRLERMTEGRMPKQTTGMTILGTMLWFFLPLLLLTLADRMWAWTKWVRKPAKAENPSAGNRNAEEQDADGKTTEQEKTT